MSFFFKGVQSVFPKSILNIMYVPTEMNGAFIGELKSRLQESAGREAFILASVPYFVQAEFAKINCPSVILGSRHAGITGIPQIEENHEQGIQLIFEYLARRGRKNIIGLMRNIVFSGDLPVLDMFTRTATPFEKRLRCISAEPELLNAAVADLLRESPSVDAFICRSLPYVEAVCSAMKQKGLTPGKDVDVISCVHYQHEGCIALRREISLQETYTMGAELLKRIISGQKVEDYYVPVNLT